MSFLGHKPVQSFYFLHSLKACINEYALGFFSLTSLIFLSFLTTGFCSDCMIVCSWENLENK